jgi:monofunctional biosynthetic peptidoglycan transglycosylase
MKKKGNLFNKILRALRIALYAFFISSILTVILYRFINPPFTPLMLIRCTEQVASGEEMAMKKDWVSIKEISPNLQTAVVASEDIHFLTHFGTAKNVFLWPGRSWIRKGVEAYFTLLIETFWSKERIMEVYLNVIEMGNGIYGAEAASQKYFKKSAAELTKSQAALIAAILPNPRKWHPDAPSSYISRKKNKILEVMRKTERIDFK